MARYVVTGGAGFIGSHLVEELLRRGESVRIADDFSCGKRENLPPAGEVELVEGIWPIRPSPARAVEGCDYVLHQAAIPSVPRSILDPLTSHRANVDGSLQLLLAARDAGVKRVVYAGSSSAYGNAAVLPKREDMKTQPLSPYALQKLVAEQYCQLFTRLYGLETVTTRYFNVFGPRQDPGFPVLGRDLALHQSVRRGHDADASTATASRPATSRTSRTWSPACCWRAMPRTSRAK